MGRFTSLAIPLVLVIIATMTVSFMSYEKAVREKVETMQAQYSVNYASDAAVDAIIEDSVDLGLDYTDYSKVTVSPSEALSTFLDVFCLSQGIPLNEEGYALVKEEYLGAFVVATFDGYYIGKTEQIRDDGTRAFLFSMKQPYMYRENDLVFYALNLVGVDAKKYSGTQISKVAAPLSREEQLRIINSQVSDAMMAAVRDNRDGDISSTFYLPTAMTNVAVTNPIDSVTVFAYISDLNVSNKKSVELFGIGGSRIKKAEYYAGFTKDGMKLYAKASNVPEGVTVDRVFASATDAAKAGYYYDISNQ